MLYWVQLLRLGLLYILGSAAEVWVTVLGLAAEAWVALLGSAAEARVAVLGSAAEAWVADGPPLSGTASPVVPRRLLSAGLHGSWLPASAIRQSPSTHRSSHLSQHMSA